MLPGVEVAALSIPMALALGLVFGAGPCSITCLPYLGPVFVASDNTRRQVWRTVAPFSAGRLTGYALLGVAAGVLGQALEKWLATPLVGWLLGSATIIVGLSLLWRRYRRQPGRCTKSTMVNHATTVAVSLSELKSASPRAASSTMSSGLFFMGAGMAFNPCAPLGTVLLAASATGSAAGGLGLGLGFGVGAVVVPTLVFAFGIAHFGKQLRDHLQRWKPGLEISAAALLILLGLGTVLGWVRP